MKSVEWNSKRLIGDVRKAYDQYRQRKLCSRNECPSRDPEWDAFYNGWIEGRINMLGEISGDDSEKCPKCGSRNIFVEPVCINGAKSTWCEWCDDCGWKVYHE